MTRPPLFALCLLLASCTAVPAQQQQQQATPTTRATTQPTVRPTTKPTSQPFQNEIEAFEATDRAHPPSPGGVMFLGSSSIRLWKTLAADFPDVSPVNRGFGGSTVPDSTGFAEPMANASKVTFTFTFSLAANAVLSESL